MNDEEGALAILNQFLSFYQSLNQRIEQLYPKDTDQFYRQLTNNMFELSSFGANKLGKQIYFNKKIKIKQKEKKINKYYDLFKSIDCCEEYNLVALFFKNLFSELAYREKDHDLNKILKQYEKEALELLDDMAKEDLDLKAYSNN